MSENPPRLRLDLMPAGRPWPLGVEWVEAESAFNFALYSRHAIAVTLLCYSERNPARPVFELRFQHPAHKTGSISLSHSGKKWYGPHGPVDLNGESRWLAYALHGASMGDDDLYVMINGHWEDRSFKVQEGQPAEWRCVVDTAQPSPNDIAEPGKESRLESTNYPVRARSVVILRRKPT